MKKINKRYQPWLTLLLTAALVACGPSPEALVAEAKQLQQAGDFAGAIVNLKGALQENPDDMQARYMLGMAYVHSGDFLSAEKELRRALDLGMPAEQVWPELGRSLLASQQYQVLLDELKMMPQGVLPVERAVFEGDAYLALGKAAEAKRAYEKALKLDPSRADGQLGMAKFALLNNDAPQTLKYIDQVLTKHPEHVGALLFKADLSRQLGNRQQALAGYQAVIRLQPNHVHAYTSKIMLLLEEDKVAEAQSDLSAALKAAPKNLMLQHVQALMDFRNGRAEAAWTTIQQVLSRAPDHLPSVLLAGAIQYSLNSPVQAELHLKKYLAKEPANLYARKLMVAALLGQQQYQRALDTLKPALEQHEQDPQVLTLAGEVYMQMGEFDQAAQYLGRASALDPDAARLRSAVGLSKLAQGQTDQGLAALEQAVKLDKKSAGPSIILALTQLQLGQTDQALVTVEQLATTQTANPLVHNLKGAVYLARKDQVAARKSFEAALALQADNVPATMNLVRLDVIEQKMDQAKQRLTALLKHKPKDLQVLFALSTLAGARNNAEEALKWLEEAKKLNPDATQPEMMLAAHYLRFEQKAKALDLMEQLHGAHPNDPAVLNALAQAQYANGKQAEALESYRRILKLTPDAAPVYYQMAILHASVNNSAAALEALRKAVGLKPSFAEAQRALVMTQASIGDLNGALASARAVQQKMANSALGYELEGDVLMQQAQVQAAVAQYELALKQAKSAGLIVKLSMALKQAGKINEAASRLSTWLVSNPQDMSVRMQYGDVLLAQQQYPAAIEQYSKVAQQQPNYVPALNNLAWLYAQTKNPKALEYAEKANKLAPNSPPVMDTLGWILLQQGNVKRALPLLKQASEAAQSLDIHYHYAAALAQAGQKAEARQLLNQVLSSGRPFSEKAAAERLLGQLGK